MTSRKRTTSTISSTHQKAPRKRPTTAKKPAPVKKPVAKKPAAVKKSAPRKNTTHPRTRKTNHHTHDSLMLTFVFGVVVFFAMCALNLIGLTEYVEEPKPTTRVTYEVGSVESFFNTLGPIAEKYADYGLYPSVMLAQAAIESHYGDSQLSYEYHNYFGIKAHDNHRSVKLSTKEVYDGQEVTINDTFCVYSSPQDCFKDYATILTTNEHFSGVVGASSPAEAARALQAGGYATDPNYAQTIIQVINEYNLTRFDPMERPTAKKDVTEESVDDTEITATDTSTEEGND